ncbi:MAG: AGE family epimerase/isomerase [Pseudomonadota bacterium]
MTDAQDKFKQWLTGTALPFWAARGFDPSARRFAERLDVDGAAVQDLPFRLMVQGRQIASFAMASLNGYGPPECVEMARLVCGTMIENYWSADGRPGWVFSLDSDGTVADPTRDTYAHAFALFALAWASQLEPGDSSVRAEYHRLAAETLDFLDEEAAVSGTDFQGYRTALPDPGGLSQNPHMHLFEALLGWFEVSGESEFLSRAKALVDLALERMINPTSGALFESYQNGWAPRLDPLERIIEPGHCHEWAWLLLRYGRLSGQDMLEPAERLYRFALSHGEDGDHMVFDQLLADGKVHKAGKRIWPQSEALKADAAFARLGDPDAEMRISRRIAALFDSFLDRPVSGAWIDHFDARGAAKVDYIPASTLYHLAFTVEALDPDAQTSACR